MSKFWICSVSRVDIFGTWISWAMHVYWLRWVERERSALLTAYCMHPMCVHHKFEIRKANPICLKVWDGMRNYQFHLSLIYSPASRDSDHAHMCIMYAYWWLWRHASDKLNRMHFTKSSISHKMPNMRERFEWEIMESAYEMFIMPSWMLCMAWTSLADIAVVVSPLFIWR